MILSGIKGARENGREDRVSKRVEFEESLGTSAKFPAGGRIISFFLTAEIIIRLAHLFSHHLQDGHEPKISVHRKDFVHRRLLAKLGQ